MKINYENLVKYKRSQSHLESYNKPCLNINYEHYTKVLIAKENALRND